ncbi:MAG: SDR family NAD(P)-dependent oxidoreductase [bacterium]|nr:SDR family NAD(P)-dependent oxidoreductase [bacterium]
MNLNGKNIIITGAGSGIGREILGELLKYDCKIIAVDLNPDPIKDISPKVTLYKCDLSLAENVDALFDFAVKTLTNIDIFIANAGFAYYEKISSANWEHIEKIYRVNTFSAIYTAEKMKEIYGDRRFSMVVTSSAMGHWSLPGYALYSSTKAAIKGFAEAYRYELNKGQKIQIIYPIATRTNFFKEAGDSPVPFPSQDAAVVAKKVVRGIKRGSNTIHPSRLYRFLLLLNRVLPVIKVLVLHIESVKFKKWLARNKTA